MELIYNNNDVKVYCFDLSDDGWNGNKIESYLLQFPLAMQQKINVYKNRIDRQHRIIGKLMLLQLIKDFGLEKKLNLSQLQYSRHNQPFFKSGLFFSTAYAGNKVVCAASKTKKVGIDVEAAVSIDSNDFMDFLSDKELLAIQKSSDPQKEFYKCWTKKEALAKAVGEGVITDFENKTEIKEKFFLFYELPIAQDYMAMLAIEK